MVHATARSAPLTRELTAVSYIFCSFNVDCNAFFHTPPDADSSSRPKKVLLLSLDSAEKKQNYVQFLLMTTRCLLSLHISMSRTYLYVIRN